MASQEQGTIGDGGISASVKLMQSDREILASLSEFRRALSRMPGTLDVLQETHAASTFSDGGAAVGTKTMSGSLPLGAITIGTKVQVPAGFAGNVSASATIGDGSDVDRYHTGTLNVFAAAADGKESGPPSGSLLHTAAVQPVITVTTSTDFTLALTGGGIITVAIYYIRTNAA